MRLALEAAERGWVPDPALRLGIRGLLESRLRREETSGTAGSSAKAGRDALVERMRSGPVAAVPERPNEQHYELPASFFEEVLGPRLKYSAGYWPPGTETLAASEERMLALTGRRARLADGQRILELGCGWGSLTLWMAERYPEARITAVSNSSRQGAFLAERAADLGAGDRLDVVTADVNEFAPRGRFDRVVSIEMFEHMRNWEELLVRIARWLEPGGELFLHVFSHRRHGYLYRDRGTGDWMARHFFTGGLMPSDDLPDRLSHPLRTEGRWRISGLHYRRTADAWLARLDERRDRVLEIFREVYGPDRAERWYRRWRLFFLAVSEMFGYRGGEEWGVVHHRLKRENGHPRGREAT